MTCYMKNIKSLFIMVCVSIVSGCASVDSRLEDKLESEFAEIKQGPNGAPYKNVTSFSDSLGLSLIHI